MVECGDPRISVLGGGSEQQTGGGNLHVSAFCYRQRGRVRMAAGTGLPRGRLPSETIAQLHAYPQHMLRMMRNFGAGNAKVYRPMRATYSPPHVHAGPGATVHPA